MTTQSEKQPAVWITRHGERVDFIDSHWGESADEPYNSPLSENGHLQARDVARRLEGEGLRHIFASPFLRTLETANTVAEHLGLPIKVERGAGEMLSADWFSGDPRTWSLDALAEAFPRIDTSYVSRVDPTYPEEWEGCKRRAAATMRGLVEEYGGDFLVVGHGATFSSLAWGVVEGFPSFQGGCCALIKLSRTEAGTWDVELGGDASHLSYREPQYRLV